MAGCGGYLNWVLWKDGQGRWALGGPRAFRGERGVSKVRARVAWVLGRRREMVRPPWVTLAPGPLRLKVCGGLRGSTSALCCVGSAYLSRKDAGFLFNVLISSLLHSNL